MKKIAIALISCIVLLSGCVTETIDHPSAEKGTVDVTLNIKVRNRTNTVTKSAPNDQDRVFDVLFSEESVWQTKSDGTTPLYNLWVFQFNPDGSIAGAPKRVSSTTVPVNDMTSLNVKLVPGSNQTIYIVVLGEVFGATVNLSSINSQAALEKFNFMGLRFANGAYQSMINSDEHIPYAGKVTGVDIEAVPGKTEGEIKFTAPNGFMGGVEIKRLMAKIVFKYQYNVEDYKAVGISLTNIPDRISIDPAKYMAEATAKVVELASQRSENPIDGYYIHTWYIPQNMQGTVGGCSTEGARYPTNTLVPAKASLIRLFANHRSDPVKYLKYSIYIGQNNTSNFDIEANWQYNLITDFLLNETSAIKDRRVEGFNLEAGSRLVAKERGRIIQTIGSIQDGVIMPKDNGADMVGSDYNFDCHFDQRPLYVQAAGRKVSVTVTEGNWLQVYSYANYTEAKNAGASFTNAEGVLIAPSELKFMIACDENLSDVNRQAKIEVVTTSEDETASVVVEYILEQNPGYGIGRIGGDIVPINQGYGYSHDLVYESVLEYTKKYDQATTSTITDGTYWGYSGVVPPIPTGYYNGTLNSWTDLYKVKDGKDLTKILAENPTGISVNGGSVPIEQQNGNLYQYDYYNSFAARICYDKNRDLNGNGVIDYLPADDTNNELRWYLPTLNQLTGAYVFSNDETPFNGKYYASDITPLTTPYPTTSLIESAFHMDFFYGFVTLGKRVKEATLFYHTRCVRDVPRTSNKGSIYKQDGYAVIDAAEAMPARGVVDRNTQTDFYQNVPLFEYMSTTTSNQTPILVNGSQAEGKRIVRHHPRSKGWKTVNANSAAETSTTPNRNVSKRFAVAPVNLNASLWNGSGATVTHPWDVASGYLITVQSAPYNSGIYGTDRGCSMYGGLSGMEYGQWRLPTFRELSLITMYLPVLAQDDYYGYADFSGSRYFTSATEEDAGSNSGATILRYCAMNLSVKLKGYPEKYLTYSVRCIKDL